MSYLFDLVRSLNGEELNALHSIPLIGKERAVLEFYIRERDKEEIGSKEGATRFRLSGSHFDKTKSILLKRCYDALVPEGGNKRLEFLYYKRSLMHLFMREVKSVAEQMKKEKKGKEIFYEFWKWIFYLYVNVPHSLYDPAICANIAKNVLKYSNDPGDALIIRARMLEARIQELNFASKYVLDKHARVVMTELNKLEKEALAIDHPGALFQVYRTNIYYHLYNDLYDLVNSYIAKALSLFKRKKHGLTEDDQYYIRYKKAEVLYFTSEYETALKEFHRVEKDFSKLFNGNIYPTYKIVQLLIINGHYKEAEERLNERAPFYKHIQNTSVAIGIQIHYTKLFLFSGEYDKAYLYLTAAKQRINKNQLVQYDIELRNLENAYFYLTGEKEFAKDLTRKNLKFLNSKGMTMENIKYGYYYHLILAVYNLQKDSIALNRKQKEMMAYCMSSSYRIYGLLLQKMMETK